MSTHHCQTRRTHDQIVRLCVPNPRNAIYPDESNPGSVMYLHAFLQFQHVLKPNLHDDELLWLHTIVDQVLASREIVDPDRPYTQHQPSRNHLPSALDDMFEHSALLIRLG